MMVEDKTQDFHSNYHIQKEGLHMAKVYTEDFVNNLTDKDFYERFGIGKVLFNVLHDRLEQYREEKHKKGGRPNNLTVFDCTIIFLLYLRHYQTQTILGDSMGVKKWAVSRAYHWVMDTLIKNGCLRIVGNRKAKSGTFLLMDVTEIFIQRPNRKQRRYYSGKKKRHTMKIQILFDCTNRKIISFYIARGKTHDFKMLKESNPRFQILLKGLADSGYQGISKKWPSIETPYKKPRGGKLSKDEKEYNHILGSIRVKIEHVNAWLKRFRILKDRYRGNVSDLWKVTLFACAVFNIECPNV